MVELSPHALASLVFAAGVFAVFIWDRLPIATVSLAVLGTLTLGFALFPMPLPGEGGATLDPMRFFAGFGNPALVAICALMIVGHALVVTGALEPVARKLSVAVARRPQLALLAVLALAASVSGVVNDTPVVVLLIPLLLAAARQAKASAAGMLLPMNYAVLIGGMATTIGTSTNLIVIGIAASLGIASFSVFSFFGLVAAAAVPALAYLWLVAPRLLGHVKAPVEHLSDDVFDAELTVAEGSWLEGRKLAEALAATRHQLPLIDIRRGPRSLARLPTMVLRAGDRLMLRDTALRLKDLEALLKAKLHDTEVDVDEAPAKAEKAEHDAPGPAAAGAPATPSVGGAEAGQRPNAARAASDGEAAATGDAPAEEAPRPARDRDGTRHAPPTAVVAQLIVTPTSRLVGRSVRQERFAERYEVAVVGLRPRQQVGGWQRDDLGDRRIAAGDVLLVQGRESAIRFAQSEGIGLLLDERFTLPRQKKAPVALWTMAVVVLLAATKLLPIALAALAGAAVLLLVRALSWDDVGQALSSKVILLVAASLALGDALQTTGATDWLAQGLAEQAAGLSPALLAALLMALMGLVTNFVSNNAAAAVGTPLGISLAQALGVPPEPFVLAVLFGCNLCYLTPMGYQTNLLVMNAGGYRFGDFLRVGAPLFVIMWAGLSFMLAQTYGLW